MRGVDATTGGGGRRWHGGSLLTTNVRHAGLDLVAGGGGDHRGGSCVQHHAAQHQTFVTCTFRTLRDTAKSQCLRGLFAVNFTEDELAIRLSVLVLMQPAAAVAIRLIVARIVRDQRAIP